MKRNSKKLTYRAEEMPIVAITDNNGRHIPIKEYSKKVYNNGFWARDV